MNEDIVIIINQVHSSTSLMVKLLLLFKSSIEASEFVVSLSIFLKLYGLFILSSRFYFNSDKLDISLLKFSDILRQLTFFNIYTKYGSILTYYIISIIIYSLELSFALYIKFLFNKLKRKTYEEQTPKLNWFGKIMFYFHLLFSQHILEHLSIVILILINPKIKIKEQDESLYYHDCKLHYYFNNNILGNTSHSLKGINICLCIVNVFLYALIIYITYLSYVCLNTPFMLSKSALKKRSCSFAFFFSIFQIFLSLHYMEIYLINVKLMVVNIIIVLTVIIVVYATIFFNLTQFEFSNIVHSMNIWGLCYCGISQVLEIFIVLGKYKLTNTLVIFIFAIKLFISFLTLKVLFLIKERTFQDLCTKNLFIVYDDNIPQISKKVIQSFFYLIEKLYIFSLRKFKCKVTKDKSLTDLISLTLNHFNECKGENCKCKAINILPSNDRDGVQFQQSFIKRIGFLIETTFIMKNYTQRSNIQILFILAEYFYIFKKNPFMTYSLVHTFMNFNHKRLKLHELVWLYSIQAKCVNVAKANITSHDQYVKFNNIFNDEIVLSKFNQMLIEYAKNYIELFNIKEVVESSLKVEHSNDTAEIRTIYSKSLTKRTTQVLIDLIHKQYINYHKIKKTTRNFELNKGSCLSYFVLCIFFQIFDYHIPKKLLNKLSAINKDINLSTLRPSELGQKFESYLEKYITGSNKNQHHIIIKCNKDFRIKSFSLQLKNILNYTNIDIINRSFDSLFPPYFKELHKRAIIHYLIMNPSNYFFSKKTYIFDSKFNAIPCIVQAASFPHLSKNMFLICEVTITKEDSYTILINQYYEALSVSRNLENNLSLSMEMVKKCEIDLMGVFDISNSFLRRSFKKFIKESVSYSKKILNSSCEIYSRFFYTSRHAGEDTGALNEAKRLKMVECAQGAKLDEKELNETIELKKRKKTIFNNLIKILNNYNEMEIKEDVQAKFGEIYNKFKRTISIGNSSKDEEYCYITIKAKMIYTLPLFIFNIKITETGDFYSIPNSKRGTQLFKLSQMPYVNKKIDKTISDENSNEKMEMSSKEIGNISNKQIKITDLPYAKGKIENNPKKIIKEEKEHNMNNNFGMSFNTRANLLLKQSTIVLESEAQSKIGIMPFKEIIKRNILIMIIISVVLMFLLSFLSIYNEMKSFPIVGSLINTILYNSLQRDKFLNLQSTYAALMFQFSGLTTSSYDMSVYYNQARNSTNEFKDTLIEFYFFYSNYNRMAHKGNFSEISDFLPFVKIITDWTPIEYNSTYIMEMNAFLYKSFKFLNEDKDISAINEDLLLLYNNNYLKYPQKRIRSLFTELIFFIFNNGNILYKNVIELLDKRLKADLADLINKKNIYFYIYETLYIINYLFFFSMLLYVLIRFNRVIFKMIASIFSVFELPKISKTNLNLKVKQTLLLFINFLDNVNIDNYNLLIKKKAEIFTKTTNISSYTPNLTETSNRISPNQNTTNTNLQTTKSFLINNSHKSIEGSDPNFISKMNSHKNLSNIIKQKRPNLFLKVNQAQLTPFHSASLNKGNHVSQFEMKKIRIIQLFQIILIFLLLFEVTISSIKFFFCNSYISNNEIIYSIFDYLSGQYTLIITVYNKLCQNAFNGIEKLSKFNNFQQWLQGLEEGNKYIKKNIKLFPTMRKFIDNTQFSLTNDSSIISDLCRGKDVCLETLLDDNSLISKGVTNGLQTILQLLVMIISELMERKNKKGSLTFEEFKEYTTNNDFSLIERTTEFVLKEFQKRVYADFYNDSRAIRFRSENWLRFIHFFSLTAGIAFMLVFVVWSYFKLRKMQRVVYFGIMKLKLLIFNSVPESGLT